MLVLLKNSKDTGKVGEKSAEISAKDTLGKAVKLADDNTSLKVLVFFKMVALLA